MLLQGIVTKLVQTVSGKITGTGQSSKPASRQNSRPDNNTGRRKSGTEMEDFEDARTTLARRSDSSDGSYQSPDVMAEPMATHQ